MGMAAPDPAGENSAGGQTDDEDPPGWFWATAPVEVIARILRLGARSHLDWLGVDAGYAATISHVCVLWRALVLKRRLGDEVDDTCVAIRRHHAQAQRLRADLEAGERNVLDQLFAAELAATTETIFRNNRYELSLR
eukprot:COSAG02_NODE_23850_length_706_cov_0.889621_1_plen_136_part_10